MPGLEYAHAIYPLLLGGMGDGDWSMMLAITIDALKVSSMRSTEVRGP